MRWGARWLVGVAALSMLLALPGAASATLVFSRFPLNSAVFSANDDGSGAHRLARGSNPHVSPDGKTVVFYRFGQGRQPPELLAIPAEGGQPRRLATGWRNPYVFAWSADSSTIAVVLGPEIGKQRLTTIDLASGSRRTIAHGYFSGVSFSPQGSEQLVYGRAASEGFPPRSDVYRIDLLSPGAVGVAPELPHRLTGDHRSSSPLWGPDGRIVFVKHLGAKRRRFGPKNDLFLMRPDGARVRRLTHTTVEPLLVGLTPTEWSADGSRLLAEFGGQDTTYAVTVNPRTGAERTLTREREVGFVGTSLSRDGSTVLGSIGGFEPGPGHRVVTIPYTGGKPKVLANNASEPDWNR